MNKHAVRKTKKVVIPVFMVLLLISVLHSLTTSNEGALTDLILNRFLLPILLLSTLMSAYWVLLTDDFWIVYNRYEDASTWTILKTIFKFLIWIPGMALFFFVVVQAFLSAYNQVAAADKVVLINGEIVDKNMYRSNGRTRYYLEINDPTLERTVELKVSEANFKDFNIGDTFQVKKKVGALGFVYD